MFCTNVVYWPSTRPNMPFQSDAPEGSDTFRWQLWEEIALAGLADDMGQSKIPWYTHRLMHRKRVACELHDSYFRLMTIKQAIPKTEWSIKLLYNSVKTGRSIKLSHRASGWASGERERHNADGHKSGGQYVSVLFGLQLPLTRTTLSRKWEVHIFLRTVSLLFTALSSLFIAPICILRAYIYIYIYIYI